MFGHWKGEEGGRERKDWLHAKLSRDATRSGVHVCHEFLGFRRKSNFQANNILFMRKRYFHYKLCTKKRLLFFSWYVFLLTRARSKEEGLLMGRINFKVVILRKLYVIQEFICVNMNVICGIGAWCKCGRKDFVWLII